MPTPLMWDAMDRCERYFSFYWNCPYKWDAKAGNLIYNGNLKTLKGWVLAQCTYILNLSAMVGCLGACNFYKSCPFSLMEVMMMVICTTALGLAFYLGVSFVLYAEDTLLAFNQLKEIHSLLVKRGICTRQGQKKWDALGICFQVIAMAFAVYPYFIAIFGMIIFNLDPFYYVARQFQLIPFFHSHLLLHLTFILMRVSLAFPTVVECGRLFPTLVMFTMLILKMLKDSVQMLQVGARGIAFDWRSRKILQNHGELEIILKMMEPSINPGILLGMGSALVVDILVNYVTLKLYGTVPMPFYLFFPSASILIPTVMQLVVPIAGAISEADKRLHQEWVFYAKNCRDKKYLKRKLRSMGTLKIHAGLPGANIFPVVSSTKRTFYMGMIDYTISALLSFK